MENKPDPVEKIKAEQIRPVSALEQQHNTSSSSNVFLQSTNSGGIFGQNSYQDPSSKNTASQTTIINKNACIPKGTSSLKVFGDNNLLNSPALFSNMSPKQAENGKQLEREDSPPLLKPGYPQFKNPTLFGARTEISPLVFGKVTDSATSVFGYPRHATDSPVISSVGNTSKLQFSQPAEDVIISNTLFGAKDTVATNLQLGICSNSSNNKNIFGTSVNTSSPTFSINSSNSKSLFQAKIDSPFQLSGEKTDTSEVHDRKNLFSTPELVTNIDPMLIFRTKKDNIKPSPVFSTKSDEMILPSSTNSPSPHFNSKQFTFTQAFGSQKKAEFGDKAESTSTSNRVAPIPIFGTAKEFSQSGQEYKSFTSKESSIYGIDLSKESRTSPINIFGGTEALKPKSSLRFSESKETFKHPLPLNSSSTETEKSVFQSTLSSGSSNRKIPASKKKSSEVVSDAESVCATDEDIFGIANLEKPSELTDKHLKPTSLIAVNVDEKYLNRNILTTHFSKFGNIIKILINKKSNQASVFFEDHHSAAEAKANGKRLHPMVPEMKLFYGAFSQEKKLTLAPVQGKEKSTFKQKELSSRKSLTDRTIVSYRDIDKFSYAKPSAPMPKTKASHKPLIRSSELLKANASLPQHKLSSASELFKPSNAAPSKVFRSVNSEIFKSKAIPEPKPLKTTSLEETLKKSDQRCKAPSSHVASIKENSLLLKQQAHNNYDKFLILDARDKNLRSKQEKILDVTKAHYLLATCPDMCPEKERYSRDIQYDLSVYELTDGKLDHRLSVKKFSRSSADKDEPLPHELRPSPVLKMTMDYLVCNIIDKEGYTTQLDVWYNYLCNRTRALRNDIMTQHLIDDNAVYVLEKITRFHIHCSHHLCEEPADLFDSKMNAEHLTKSLQSLKESYHDMGEKSVFYGTEAEFRAYEILLDANDGNVIFKYLNFRDSVRKTDEVQFAVKVVKAIQSNNFVKFFKLFANATYLQACIMHRHFLSIRLDALRIITKAYSLPKEPQTLPIVRVMSMLGFSDEKSFIDVTKYFGLTVEDSKINIDKVNFFIDPDNLPPLKKNMDLVELKKLTSSGIIVQGAPLPENPFQFYNPHNSFDALGYLKQIAYDASDQREKNSFNKLSKLVPLNSLDKSTNENAKNTKEQISNEEMEKELIEKVSIMHEINLERRFFKNWKHFTQQQKDKKIAVKKEKLKKVVTHWRKITSENIILNQKADRHILSIYFRQFQNKIVISKGYKNIIEKVKSMAERILIKKYIRRWKNFVYEQKLHSTIRSLRKKVICRKFFINWRLKTILLILERRLELYYKSKLMKICLIRWKNWLSMKKGQRKVDYESFPACGSQFSIEKQNLLWNWGYNRTESINMSTLQISHLDRKIADMSKKHISLQKLSGLIAWSPLPIIPKFQSFIDLLPMKAPINNFHPCFKIKIFIEPSTDLYLLEWIRTKFNFNEMDEFNRPVDSKVTLTSRLDGTKYDIIVQEENIKSSNKDASLSILVCNNNFLISSEFHACFQNSLSLILSHTWEDSHCGKNTWILNKEAIDDPVTSEKLFFLIYDLWKDHFAIANIHKSSLQTLVNSFISKKVMGPIFHTAGKVLQHGQSFLSPSIFVMCYNDAMSYIIKCLEKSRTLQGMPINYWNEHKIDKIIESLKVAFLPNFTVLDWPICADLNGQLVKYLRNVADNSDWCGNLFSEIRKITHLCSSTISNELLEDNNIHEREVRNSFEVSWLDIISCCIFYKISYLPDLEVLYDFHFLDSYSVQHWVEKVHESDLMNNQKLESFKKDAQKRKASQLPLDAQPQAKQTKPSELLCELNKEKEEYLNFENKYGKFDEIEIELKLLREKYNC